MGDNTASSAPVFLLLVSPVPTLFLPQTILLWNACLLISEFWTPIAERAVSLSVLLSWRIQNRTSSTNFCNYACNSIGAKEVNSAYPAVCRRFLYLSCLFWVAVPQEVSHLILAFLSVFHCEAFTPCPMVPNTWSKCLANKNSFFFLEGNFSTALYRFKGHQTPYSHASCVESSTMCRSMQNVYFQSFWGQTNSWHI